MYLYNMKKPQSINTLQREVWGHNLDLETHTVETHIYRLRKKLLKSLKMRILLLVLKMDTLVMKKRNYIAKDLLSKKYKPRIIKPKKG